MSDQLAGDRARFNAFLRRCVKLGYRECTAPPVEDIFAACDESYFLRLAVPVIVCTYFNNFYLNALALLFPPT